MYPAPPAESERGPAGLAQDHLAEISAPPNDGNGCATPAPFGAAVAAPDRRLCSLRAKARIAHSKGIVHRDINPANIFVTEREHAKELTGQEISQFGRRGLKPIVFVLNNSSYVIERLLCKERSCSVALPDSPKALGCDDWFTARVTTCGEFDQALEIASQGDRAAYIEVVTDKYAALPCP